MQRIVLVASMVGLAFLGCEEEKKPAPAPTATPQPAKPPPPPAETATAAPTAAPSASAKVDPERAKLMTEKTELKAKVESGKGSAADKKKLKELCMKLGDISCVR